MTTKELLNKAFDAGVDYKNSFIDEDYTTDSKGNEYPAISIIKDPTHRVFKEPDFEQWYQEIFNQKKDKDLKNESAKDMEHISDALIAAHTYKLECEMLAWAFYAMRADPTQTIQQCLFEGLYEWDL